MNPRRLPRLKGMFTDTKAFSGFAVDDVDAARAQLSEGGVQVSDVVQMGPEGTPGSRYVFFEDPDGNSWAVQEDKPE